MRAAFVFILCLGLATAASAAVDRADIAGFPRFVDVWRPGVYSASSTQKVEAWDHGTLVGEFFEADVYGTFLAPSGCFAIVKNDGTLISNSNCIRSDNIFPGDTSSTTPDVRRVRFTPSGTGYATVRLGSTDFQLLTTLPASTVAPPWRTLKVDDPFFTPTEVMNVTETDGGVPHAIFVSRTGAGDFLWYRGMELSSQVVIPAGLPQDLPVTVDLFADEGPNPVAIYASDAGLFRGELVPADGGVATTPFTPVTILDAGTRVRIISVDVNTGQGSVHGEGYGLALGLGDHDEVVLLGSVPTDSAADAGTLWRVNPKVDTSLLQEPREVNCVDSTFCVIRTETPGETPVGNLRLYTNAEAPRFESGTQPVVLNEGSVQAQTRVIIATDDDGDAVRVSLDPPSASGLVDVSATLQPDTLDLRITPRVTEVCKDETQELTVYAADGLGTHDQTGKVRVTIANVRGPEAPGVTPLNDVAVAGGASRVFTASPSAVGLCQPVGYTWKSTTSSQPALVPAANGTATFTPPDVLCVPAGVRYTYTVEGLDEGGLASTPTSFTVDVAPWGKPLAPFSAGTTRTLLAGPDAGVVVTPEAPQHLCTGTPGLPTVETVWRLTNPGAGVPAAFTVRDADGGTVSLSSPVVSPELRVEAQACTRGSLSFTAFNRIQTAASGVQDGPEATVSVDAVPAPEDISAAQLSLTTTSVGPRQVDVQLGTSLLCPAEYDLKAQMSLRAQDGTVLADEVVDVEKGWTAPLPASCSAQAYVVHGQLFDESTGTRRNGGTAETQVSAPALPVQLGTVQGDAMVARCGERATATLTQTLPADACQSVDISWKQVSGPALAEAELGGAQVAVATRDTGFEGLVGESVVLSVTADAGGGNSATVEHTVPITVAPFVDVVHESESSTGSEKNLAGVVVTLRNTTACQVESLRHVEQVDGVDWVPGSVRVDGQPVTEQPAEGGFAVEGITLPANGTSTLTYVTRPRLLSSASFEGAVFLNGVQVSGSVQAPATSGCGCSGGGAGSAVFGLLALARLLRRRRGV
ncbi:hypothetical protein JY651_10015 [Pyxidicoccus parkwayensis]|uniref:Uncharacterized protein n=1 Tax=Pyxidicoccus parkwayensis TaxID=2813578 RepID=A0ABX7P423_9BACT|nr:MYXO-CTERM sorting domain-containing protein [Pyxidicoccus parkwaysis]QSQ25234.1 hypothetical protein JY651_10015 [Pyxidicoccus parkwaysis]